MRVQYLSDLNKDFVILTLTEHADKGIAIVTKHEAYLTIFQFEKTKLVIIFLRTILQKWPIVRIYCREKKPSVQP